MPASLESPFPRIEDVDASAFNWHAFKWQALQTKLEDTVLLVQLNRPKQMNSFTSAMMHEIVFAFELADADDRVKAVVLTGNGRAFCAGADLNSGFADGGKANVHQHRDGGGQAALAILNCRKLTIGAINGAAVGIGMTMVLPLDIRFVAESAKIAFPFVKRGICLEATSSYLLPRLIGHSKALELTITGDVIPATTPALSNLWREVLPAEQVLPAALKLARRLVAENSTVSMALSKNLMWRGLDSPEATHLIDSQAIAACSAGGDAKEGIDSFMQKRPPAFKGTIKDMEEMPFYPWWPQQYVRQGIKRAPRNLKL